MPTLVTMAAVLYVALTLVMLYTYCCRRTYPGFGAFTLGQLLWCIGIFITYFRFFGDKPSLVVGNFLLMSQPLFFSYGVMRYSGVEKERRQLFENVAFFTIAAVLFLYFILVRYETCPRILIFSGYSAILYLRVGAEPYCRKQWKTHSLQPLFATINCLISLVFILRFVTTLGQTNCLVGGIDNLTKCLVLLTSLFFPLLTYSLLAMTSGRVEDELRRTQAALRQQAETDPLTGLANRRHFLKLARLAIQQAREQGRPVSFLMVDLDYFKRINDGYGHQTGDLVLREVAGCLTAGVRDRDTVGRLGGEEFGILFPGLGMGAAIQVAQRLRRAVAALVPGGHAITASLGVASGTDDLDAVLARADECLYAAKGAGRNTVGFRTMETREMCVTADGC